jgi:hypothetical protein
MERLLDTKPIIDFMGSADRNGHEDWVALRGPNSQECLDWSSVQKSSDPGFYTRQLLITLQEIFNYSPRLVVEVAGGSTPWVFQTYLQQG